MRQMCRRQFFMLINAASRELPSLCLSAFLTPLPLSLSHSFSPASQAHCICIPGAYCPAPCSTLSLSLPLSLVFVLFHHIHRRHCSYATFVNKGNSNYSFCSPPPRSLDLHTQSARVKLRVFSSIFETVCHNFIESSLWGWSLGGGGDGALFLLFCFVSFVFRLYFLLFRHCLPCVKFYCANMTNRQVSRGFCSLLFNFRAAYSVSSALMG